MSTVRILHAADLHLDSPFEALSEPLAVQRRREQRALLKRIPALAEKHGAQIILLSGDLLDTDSAYPETARLLSEVFEGSSAKVFISPGNHDFYSQSSPYARLRFPANVHIFREPRLTAVTVPELNVRVWGAGFTDRRCGALLRGFHAQRQGEQTELLCVHGEVGNPASAYNPITVEELAASGVDYAALGHIHTCSGVRRAGQTIYAWPGCPEGRGFDESGEKGVLLADVAPGSVRAAFLPLGGRRYETLRVSVEETDPLEAVLAALPEDSARHIYRLILTGACDRAPALPAIRRGLEGRVFAAELRDETRLREDLWAHAGEDTLRGLFLRRLKQQLETAPDAETRERITQAARWGLAALSRDEEVFPL